MHDLFIQATRAAYRYPSNRGEITTEQLWDMPLLSKGNGFDLDTVARTLNASIKAMGEESFVETRSNPRKVEAEAKLEVVKFVIATKQAEIKAAEQRANRLLERRKILDALAELEAKELSASSKEDLLKRLSELEG